MTKAPEGDIRRLLAIMARLRAAQGGCPWDLEQTFRTIAPYTIEEAYEVADAIERGDMGALRDELGDLLFQVAFHARMAEEAGAFSFSDVVAAISAKMERRHPHVFAGAAVGSAAEQTDAWEAQKSEERRNKGSQSLLDDVPAALPGMTRAVKLQQRAARVGFDWTEIGDVLAKLDEEVKELAVAAKSREPDAIEDEFGDLLFVIANVARHLKVDPETSLRRANEKFIRRFRHIEKRLAEEGRDIAATSLADMEALWLEAKRLERQ
jgi:tetrapyrrole methylase family protein/MazG family protein/ATP diphosphatase